MAQTGGLMGGLNEELLAVAVGVGSTLLRIYPKRLQRLGLDTEQVLPVAEAALGTRFFSTFKVWSPDDAARFGGDTLTVDGVSQGLLLHLVALEGERLVRDGLRSIDVANVSWIFEQRNQLALQREQFLSDIVARYDWPSEERFGKTAACAAFEIAVESTDLESFYFLASEEFLPGQRVRALDEITIAKFGWQRYGTSFRLFRGGDGGMLLEAPKIKEPHKVDRRRASIGLPPLEESLKAYSKFVDATVRLPKGYELGE